MTSSYFYISSVLLFDNIRQSSIKCLYINVFRCFKALLFNYAIFISNCQKVPIFKAFRHFSTHSVLKHHCSIKCIRNMLVLIIFCTLFYKFFPMLEHFINISLSMCLFFCFASALCTIMYCFPALLHLSSFAFCRFIAF